MNIEDGNIQSEQSPTPPPPITESEIADLDTAIGPTPPEVSKPKRKYTRRAAPAPAVETRPAILNMSGFPNADALENAMPDSTATAAEKPKRGRKKATPEDENPHANDKRYMDAVARMSGFGGAQVVDAGFRVTGKPLDKTEKQDVDDYFYVLTKQYPSFNPAGSPLLMSLYAVFMLLRMIAVRAMGTTSESMWEQFRGLFSGNKEAEEAAEVN